MCPSPDIQNAMHSFWEIVPDFSVYELKTAKKELPKNASVIFLGWLMAGTVKGYKKAKRRFDVFSKNA